MAEPADQGSTLRRTNGADDPVHRRLKKAVERRECAYLWVPADAISFVPRLLPIFYGDGRALFTLTTINQRPAYWVIRGCSSWGCDLDLVTVYPKFGEFTDDILTDLEEAFGSGRCGYSGNSLFFSRRERLLDCQCEECSDRHVAKWPEVDGSGGCSWSRMDWPKSFETVEDPRFGNGNLLRLQGKDGDAS